MTSIKRIQFIISYILLIGTIFSAGLVLVGGFMYLYQNGAANMHIEVLHADAFAANIIDILYIGFSFTPIGIIILGLLSLIVTQILRVAMLCGFYTFTRDYWFIFISLFILAVMIYSVFWRV